MKILGVYESRIGGYAGTLGKGLLAWPDSALIRSGKPLFIPDDSAYRLFVAPALKVSRLGKSVTPKFASRYWEELVPVAVMLPERAASMLAMKNDPFATDLMADCAVVCGDFISKETLDKESCLTVSTSPLDNTEALFSVNYKLDDITILAESAICAASSHNTLKIGDLIIPDLSGEGLKAVLDTKWRISIGHRELLRFNLK